MNTARNMLVGMSIGWVVSSIGLAAYGLFNGGSIGFGFAIIVAWICYGWKRGTSGDDYD